jgi:hypothetical protein
MISAWARGAAFTAAAGTGTVIFAWPRGNGEGHDHGPGAATVPGSGMIHDEGGARSISDRSAPEVSIMDV